MIKNLKILRKSRKVTLKTLGLAIGKTTGAISQIENNMTNCTIETLIKIAKFFNVSTDYLLGLKETEN